MVLAAVLALAGLLLVLFGDRTELASELETLGVIALIAAVCVAAYVLLSRARGRR